MAARDLVAETEETLAGWAVCSGVAAQEGAAEAATGEGAAGSARERVVDVEGRAVCWDTVVEAVAHSAAPREYPCAQSTWVGTRLGSRAAGWC